eukprot:297892-Chlamydomonas_euryale.AAC.1
MVHVSLLPNSSHSGKSPAVQRCPEVSTRVQRCPWLSRPVHGRPWTQAGSLRRHFRPRRLQPQ